MSLPLVDRVNRPFYPRPYRWLGGESEGACDESLPQHDFQHSDGGCGVVAGDASGVPQTVKDITARPGLSSLDDDDEGTKAKL